jgi:hypothetical protein
MGNQGTTTVFLDRMVFGARNLLNVLTNLSPFRKSSFICDLGGISTSCSIKIEVILVVHLFFTNIINKDEMWPKLPPGELA